MHTPTHLHTFTRPGPHICTLSPQMSVHLHICTRSQLHTFAHVGGRTCTRPSAEGCTHTPSPEVPRLRAAPYALQKPRGRRASEDIHPPEESHPAPTPSPPRRDDPPRVAGSCRDRHGHQVEQPRNRAPLVAIPSGGTPSVSQEPRPRRAYIYR